MQIEQLQVDVHVDIRKNSTQNLGVTLMSRDINNYSFYLRVLQDGELLVMDDSYEVEVLSLFTTSKSRLLTKGTIKSQYVDWVFDPSYISKSEVVKNYVYVRKNGVLLVSADANCFIFSVGLSAIDSDVGRVAEMYDENYEKVLLDYSGALDDRTTERLDEAVLDFNQRGDAEIVDWRDYADVELEDYLADRVGLKNLIANGDFSDGTNGWSHNRTTLSVADGVIMATVASLGTGHGMFQQGVVAGINDKMYVSVKVKVPNNGSLRVAFNNDTYNLISIEGNKWSKVSDVFQKTIDNDTFVCYVMNAGLVVGDVIQYDDINLINLTQTFGAGNEPSKELMDRLIEQTGYFDEHILDEDWQVGEMLRLDGTKASKVQEDWITPTLLNGWEAQSALQTPRYYKDAFGIVHIDGCVKSGVNDTVLFNLPIGYRLSRSIRFPSSTGDSSVGRVDVRAGGVVAPHKGVGAYAYLSNISFRAEA